MRFFPFRVRFFFLLKKLSKLKMGDWWTACAHGTHSDAVNFFYDDEDDSSPLSLFCAHWSLFAACAVHFLLPPLALCSLFTFPYSRFLFSLPPPARITLSVDINIKGRFFCCCGSLEWYCMRRTKKGMFVLHMNTLTYGCDFTSRCWEGKSFPKNPTRQTAQEFKLISTFVIFFPRILK